MPMLVTAGPKDRADPQRAPAPQIDPADGRIDLTALVRSRLRERLTLLALVALAILAFLGAIALGSLPIPLGEVLTVILGNEPSNPGWTTIIETVRLPRAITASLAGAALGIAGLQMQTLLRNPLADPFALGITSGSSLGVALIVLGAGGSAAALLGGGLGLGGDAAVAVAAILGAFVVLVPVLAIASRIRSPATILIIGLMFGYAVQAVVTILVVGTSFEQLQRWISWGFGSFSAVTNDQLVIFAPLAAAGIVVAALTSKQLNALLLGEPVARSMGLNVRRMRLATLASASILAGVVTAFCGPIAFLGVAIPHLARGLFRTSDHRVLIPGVIVLGAIVALVAQTLALVVVRGGLLPLNAVTSLVGAPVVVWIVLRARKGAFIG
jgi:iron complex transport system permease protein